MVSDDGSAVANAVPSVLNAAIAASVAEVSTADCVTFCSPAFRYDWMYVLTIFLAVVAVLGSC